MKHEMPVLTKQQRADLIWSTKYFIECSHAGISDASDMDVLMAQVALASLTTPPASAEPASQWVKCSDGRPHAFVDVIASDGSEVFTAYYAMMDGKEEWVVISELAEEHGEITHWMEMPAAPAPGGDEAVITCWSCKKNNLMSRLLENDSLCCECSSEIDLEESDDD